MSWVILLGVLGIATADDFAFTPPFPRFPGIDPAVVQAAISGTPQPQHSPFPPSSPATRSDVYRSPARRVIRSLEDAIRVQFPVQKMYRLTDGTYVTTQSRITDDFMFSYLTPGGTSRSEAGTFRQLSQGSPAVVVRGSYSYVSPEGQNVHVHYTADENGFNARAL